ncbi:MAG TPA: trypsin-like peptidase domain-containing protein [Streptosporangiaceae bacterium]|nr:trypsin-like peptidase domain-containing protein [Streptosporangiaceae bacterium]
MQDYRGFGEPPSGYPYSGPTLPMPPRPPRRGTGVLSYLVVAVLAAALGAGVTLGLYRPAPASSNGVAAPAPLPSNAVPSPGTGSGSASGEQAIFNKVEPGLVTVNSTIQYQGEQGRGTGMVINPDGLVLTNNHVIEDSTRLSATVVATGKTYPARVLGYDTTGDVALIKLEGASGLRVVQPGNSADVKVGDPVLAMGDAEGQGTIVPAAGRVTALNQTITASDSGGTISSETLHGMIETNADIVSGDSGGPLVNASGRVIGMDTAGSGGGGFSFPQQQQQAGFAIPINTALAVARQIAAGKASSTVTIGYPPFIGIYVAQGSDPSPADQDQQQQQSNPFGGFGGGQGCYTSDSDLAAPSGIAPVSSGTLVIGVICGSPAQAAGITAGSVITAIDGRAVGAPDSLTAIMAGHHPGQTISVTWVSPSGQRTTSSVRLAAGPPL